MYKVQFNLKSFDWNSLNQMETYLIKIFSFFNLYQFQNKGKPKKIKKITILRSPHIDKKSREQFQICTLKKQLVLSIKDQNIFFMLVEILKHLKTIGVEIEIIVDFSTT